MNVKRTHMTNTLSARQVELLQDILSRGRRIRLNKEIKVDRGRFLENYYASSHEEDLEDNPTMRASAALDHLRWAQKRRPGSAKVRVFNPTAERDGWTCEHTVVQTVTDDMPFLVDSLTMALNSHSRGIHATIHSVLDIRRNGRGEIVAVDGKQNAGARQAESFVHFEIARETKAAVLAEIESTVMRTLDSVRAGVEDWPAMLDQLRDAAAAVGAQRTANAKESQEFLLWLADNHFTLLGYRELDLVRGARADRLNPRPGSGLGILRDGMRPAKTMTLSGSARKEARSKDPLVITKANAISSVHRPVPLDYIGVKVFDADGLPCAERRFLGLFTSTAYSKSPRDIPLLRLKVQRIMERSGLDPVSHRGKALQHILDTFPRDDLFQGSLADLARISTGILGLQARHRVSLFCRKDTFERFYSCLVYLPRDQFNYKARQAVEAILLEGFRGSSLQSNVTISDAAFARIEVIIRTDPGEKRAPNVKSLQDQLQEAVRGWEDRARAAAFEQLPEDQALELFERFAAAFPVAYQESIAPSRSVDDMLKIAALVDGGQSLQMSLRGSETPHRVLFTTFQLDEPIHLYLAHPILEHMGLRVVSESNYRLDIEPRTVWIQDFELETDDGSSLDTAEITERFQECFARTLSNDAENDGFNALVVSAGLDWRDAALLRAYCKYILQTSNRFSQSYMQQVLRSYPMLCGALLDYFHGTFDPALEGKARKQRCAESDRIVTAQLDRATSLDDDRILRSFVAAVRATLRTNFFQTEDGKPKPYISIKLDPKGIPDLPRPRPMFEIFVYSRRVEGVHLRCGTIARGGLRWSDRREDFRTEVLGLMKAQQVKNTVIVPTGAKGGFVCKALPSGDRSAIQVEVVACYKIFIRGLLDITDNIVGSKVETPDGVVARDAADTYLVEAADKGTATFSDIANELSRQYGFWLDDAFASGGSAGYDHKKMAITARGAWEAVKRHFREFGVDTQTQDFTVIGIGDMGGDVFGNGMLLSRHIRLLAAFNHQHIFIDPEPDAASSFKERQRLFELPRSSWDDYDRKLLSEGGGIYSRESKSIELHPRARAMLGIDKQKLTPPELVRAILLAKADLLWNGGIGTYVKASSESHGDAGDPVNDTVRVDGDELNCRVIGEGGNLGLTQRGRIEFALGGGRINTDFIDNSGGVDSSDREVNIKILLNGAIESGKLARNKRNTLLATMTDNVAELVLANNYAQTQALSMMASRANERLGEHARLIRMLEARGLLDRDLEFLPGEEQLEQRKSAGLGLTRPELAIILSYSKIELSSSLVATDIPEDPVCAAELESYFPAKLVKRFKPEIYEHRLRREMIAMLIASSMVNRMGPFFVLRAEEDTGAGVAKVARAYAIVREIFHTRQVWREIEALDHAVQAEVQYDAVFQISRMVRRAVYWFLQRTAGELAIEPTVKRMQSGVAKLLVALPKVLGGRAKKRFDAEVRQFEGLGLPLTIATKVAAFKVMTQMLDIVELAGARKLPVETVAKLYFDLGRGLRLDWIREQIEMLKVEGRWRATARASLRETLAQEQRALVETVLKGAGKRDSDDALATWLDESKAQISRTQRALDDMRTSGEIDFATLSVALKEIGRLV